MRPLVSSKGNASRKYDHSVVARRLVMAKLPLEVKGVVSKLPSHANRSSFDGCRAQ